MDVDLLEGWTTDTDVRAILVLYVSHVTDRFLPKALIQRLLEAFA